MDIRTILNDISENSYLISMTPAQRLIQLGFEAGMTSQSTVLESKVQSMIQFSVRLAA